MKTLKEFLADRAEIERVKSDEQKMLQSEWTGAVRRLVEQIKEWLWDADPGRILNLRQDSIELDEIELGVYTVPQLLIRLHTQEVRLVPVARLVEGDDLSNGLIQVPHSFGRVDLNGGHKRYSLFRSRKEPDDAWLILEDDGFKAERFDRAAFEEAIQRLFQ